MERQPPRFETFAEFEQGRRNAHLTCCCGRITYASVPKLREACCRIGIEETVTAIAPHLRCSECGARGPLIIPVRGWG